MASRQNIGPFTATRSILRRVYNLIADREAAKGLQRLAKKPQLPRGVHVFGNLGVGNLPGREDLYTDGFNTYLVRNKRPDGTVTWYQLGTPPAANP